MKLRMATAILALTVGTAFAASHGGDNPMVGGAPMFADKNIVENAVNSADHTTLVAAVQAAGLVDTLKGAGPFTVFAPTNAAFDALPAGTVDTLLKPENKDELVSLLNYHVIRGRKTTSDLGKWEQAKMVNGQSAPIKLVDRRVSIGGAQVTSADIASRNGLIHGIDTVNIPTKQ